MKKFVNFTGEETEKEFLKKCVEQWEITAGSDSPDIFKVIQISTVFSEMKHRIEELD